MKNVRNLKSIMLLFALIFSFLFIKANNVSISNVSLTAVDDSTKKINFNLSWDQSWRTSTSPNNHDAVWLFVKYKDCASGNWRHAKLSDTLVHHTVAAPLELFIDGKDSYPTVLNYANGIIARRSASGNGNIANVAISLEMIKLSPGEHDYRIFGIEMVYIPTGSFYLGDGINTGTFKVGNTTDPFQVTTDGAITAANSVPNLYASATVPLNILAAFPTGYDSIYCMKYEISQGQYSDFLNTLNQDQATVRAYTAAANGNNISGVWPNYASSTPDRANNHMAWADMLAYLDWSCLRPMSEMEFEKICRGPAIPIRYEYAWGTSNIYSMTVAAIATGTDGQPNEQFINPITLGFGVGCMNGMLRPIRCGFASTPTSTRLEAGATFYGVMEMTGNLHEYTITTGHATGQSFASVNIGDGQLALTPTPGEADVLTWPSTDGTANTGFGTRGGGFDAAVGASAPAAPTSSTGQVSERSRAIWANAPRYYYTGGRGVR